MEIKKSHLIKFIIAIGIATLIGCNNQFRNGWSVDRGSDKFTNIQYTIASLKSDNSIEMGDFQPRLNAAIKLYKPDGSSTIDPPRVQFTGGVFNVYTQNGYCLFGNCSVQVRFDDGPINAYSMFQVVNVNNTIICCAKDKDSDDFYSKLQQAKKIYLRVHLLGSKNNVADFTFSTSSTLSWKNSNGNQRIDSNNNFKENLNITPLLAIQIAIGFAILGVLIYKIKDLNLFDPPNKTLANQSIIVECPNCDQKCRIPANKTLEIKCPNCRTKWFENT